MELTKEAIEQKIKDLVLETQTFARNAQAEVNAIQQALQNKIRESQKSVDNLEGKIAGYQELLKEMYPSAEAKQPEPTPEAGPEVPDEKKSE
jgi:hypothetical protein